MAVRTETRVYDERQHTYVRRIFVGTYREPTASVTVLAQRGATLGRQTVPTDGHRIALSARTWPGTLTVEEAEHIGNALLDAAREARR
jgi:hypothetical protein